jgi:CRISPR/Cas system-associated protein Cas10 (large subunit of type III CRISPR-Cas system)
MLAQCDVVTINCPLHEKTRGLFNKDLISKMKKGELLRSLSHSILTIFRFLPNQHCSRSHRSQGRCRRSSKERSLEWLWW